MTELDDDARGGGGSGSDTGGSLRRRRSPACAPTIWRRPRSLRSSSAAGIDPGAIEDVYLGCANQAGEDNRNVARMAALLAGLPQSVAGVTVNRLCASGLAAVVAACHAVAAGDGDLFVAGGVESMSRAPLVTGQARDGLPARRPHALGHDARLALPQPAPRGDVPARVDGRDRRERRRALRRLAARTRTRSPTSRSAATPPPRRRAASTRSSSPSAELERDEHPRPDTSAREARQPQAGLPGGRHGHRRQRERHQRRRRRAR